LANLGEDLARLQEVDLKIDKIKNFIDHYDDFGKKLDAEKAEIKGQADEEKATLDELKKQKAKLELDLKEGEEHIKKCNGRLYQVKTNKEYEGTLKEIEEQKRKNSDIETELLLIFDRIDEETKKLAEARAKLEVEEKQVEQKKKELAQKLERAKALLPVAEKERVEAVAALKPDVLETYLWLQERIGARVVARAAGEICQSCFLKMNSQMYNEVLVGQKLLSCPGCNRFLIYREKDFLAGQDFEF